MGYDTFEALRYKENIWKWLLKSMPKIKIDITPDLSSQVFEDKIPSITYFCKNPSFKLLP